MITAKTKAELAVALQGVPGGEIKFVPTMGALHRGHMSLVRAAKDSPRLPLADGEGTSPSGRRRVPGAQTPLLAKEECPKGGVVVVSIFVNPTQFNDPGDLRNYPRTPERDLAMLEAEWVDVVFMPSVGEIYPEPDTRTFDFGELDKVMEGATRPGHFNGVAQVVSRLFGLVKPAQAFFGQKDFQQVAIVREMVRQAREVGEDWADVEIVECPTVREADGLAMSSRNALLTPEHRAAAPDICRALRLGIEKAAGMSAAEEFDIPELRKFVTGEVERSGLLKVIYFDFMGPQACIAVQAGNVRLIDNMRYDN